MYNPNAPGFAEMDFDFANTHENAHRADVMHMRSYRSEGFKHAVQLAGERVLKNMEGYQRVAQSVRSKSLKDVFSALSAGKLYTQFGHSVEYWERNPSFTFTEIFAELFTMETQGDSDLYFVKTLFPELWDEYQKLF